MLSSLCYFLCVSFCVCLCFSVSLCVSLCLLLSLCFFFFLCFLVFRSTRKVSNVVSYFDLVFIVTFFVLSSLCLSVSVSLSLCISVSVSVFLFLPLFTCFQVNNTEGLKCCKLFWFGIVSLRYLLSVSLCVCLCVCLLCVSMFQVMKRRAAYVLYESYVLYNKCILFIFKVNKIHPGFWRTYYNCLSIAWV